MARNELAERLGATVHERSCQPFMSLLQHSNAAVGRGDLVQDLARAVRGAIVDDDQLDRRFLLCQHTLERSAHVRSRLVDTGDDGNCGWVHLVSTMIGPCRCRVSACRSLLDGDTMRGD